MSVLEFSLSHSHNIKDYDENSACKNFSCLLLSLLLAPIVSYSGVHVPFWLGPVLLDEFVEFLREKEEL